MKTICRCTALALCWLIRPWGTDLRRLVHKLRATGTHPVSQHVMDALVQAEDHRFGTHPGIDLIGVGRALFMTVCRRQRQGGSTIQQQLVRSTTGRYEATLRRKIREMVFAAALAQYFSDDQVLVLYLMNGYFGYGMVGLLQACDRLQIDARRATPRQAAELVARLRYPEPKARTPAQMTKIDRRAKHILNRITRTDQGRDVAHGSDESRASVSGVLAD